MAKVLTYVIGCKLPNGLTFRHEGKSITLAGANSSLLLNGFGITRDVPADAWEAFEKAFKDQKIIRNGIVFAVTDYASAEDASKERSKQKTGLEQAPKVQKSNDPNKDGISPLTED
ncbi:hypothetical protein [Morganella morganii]|uniref:hypothetical protein n=1 Tax=Morganella morganii TaxID=582 RepID=UPI00069B86A0|nr:hypothetical protein [Morganella morganii]KNZ84063.1 hypothetical protein AKG16_18940 [Morganella morganii]